MKKPTKKEREAARSMSPYVADRYTDAEEDAMFEVGYRRLKEQSKVGKVAVK